MVAVLAGGMGIGTASASSAALTYPGGGTWESGADCCSVWSEYLHPSKAHRASVQGRTYESSQWRGVNVWAFAEVGTALTGNKAYWDVR
ncbi:lactococcin 972 family bacteriocin [Cellulomonas sp. KRMCY2]|uniref:lactococcin 972 family bacteriocin n=1 Tax=Cellulomonas sp. KRMCY2 TaxID=1304865 RepID=UPI0006851D58|nr:lactococcin 972 family bacteriocin [Cellulomonas sp. KRMCY2]